MPPLTALAAIRLALEKRGGGNKGGRENKMSKMLPPMLSLSPFASICAHFVNKLLDTTQAVERRKVTEEEHLYHSREEKG